MNVVKLALYRLSAALARLGVIDGRRGERTADLAWPRIVTGVARMSQQIADLAMIGLVLGPPALAGMAFAFAYWQIGNLLSLGLSGGTISLVSQHFGADDPAGIDVATKQSVWVAIGLAVPLTVLFVTVPTELIRLLGAASEAIEFGSVYLRTVSLVLVFEYLNKIASRVLVGVDDAITPMYVRSGGALANVVLNAVFIFGFGLGVFGAALGTAIATLLTVGAFLLGFFGVDLPITGRFPVELQRGPPYLDVGIVRQLVAISAPLMGRWLAHSVVIFPFLAIVSTFGTGAVAAFEIARRLRGFMNAPGWGFGLASSSLVGQHLGTGDESEASAYGWDILRFTLVSYVAVAAFVFVFARPLSRIFVERPDVLGQATTFVRVAAFATLWMGVDTAATGALRGAGDTRWPLYGKIAGLYVVALPIAYLGVITPLGLTAVYVAFAAEAIVPAAVSFLRFRTGRWIEISRTYRPQTGD